MTGNISLGAHFPDFWTYVLFVVSAGVLGGLGNILLSGEFRLWRKVKSEDHQGVYYSIGSLKEPLIGGIGALLVTLMFFETYKNVENVLYLSILTGFGSSAFLKRYIDGKIDLIQQQSTALLQTENLQYYEESNSTGDTGVKGIMTTNGPLPVYLTKDEMQRLLALQSRLGDAISHKEAKVYQFEMKALINRGKQRAF
ncbi:hypothetical protein [Alkalihalobacillus sp. R86527]|uniref:hypothetical protein n=1 Tax=Alkalihalobacillus sp. R86527 TaxID=3093863 RepID=UPI00367087C2